MNSFDTSPSLITRPRPVKTFNRAKLFHSLAAAFLLVMMLWGFNQFYMHGKAYPGRSLTPPIRTLLILHGTAMAAWMLLSLVQPLLIVRNNRRTHMTLGKVGAVIALCILILGVKLGIESARVNPPEMRLWGLSPKQFMAVPVISIVIFASFVIFGILNRRRAEVHRSMMLLATLTVMPAALDRIDAVKNLYASTVWGTVFGPFFSMLVIAVIFLVVKWALERKVDKHYALGCAFLAISSVFILQLATTRAWDKFAGLLLR
jgi:hypothetical protein